MKWITQGLAASDEKIQSQFLNEFMQSLAFCCRERLDYQLLAISENMEIEAIDILKKLIDFYEENEKQIQKTQKERQEQLQSLNYFIKEKEEHLAMLEKQIDKGGE